MAKNRQNLLLLGLTAVFIGYFMVWLPGPNVGLQFLGFEMGEWTKFLGMNTRRNLFYLPSILLSAILLFTTLSWSPKRWQTWVWRLIAIAISFLVFPALEDLRSPAVAEYTPRILWIGIVILLFVAVSALNWIFGKRQWLKFVSYSLIILTALAGAILPTQVYLEVKTAVTPLFGLEVGIGWGVWLNGIGFLLIAGISISQLIALGKNKGRN